MKHTKRFLTILLLLCLSLSACSGDDSSRVFGEVTDTTNVSSDFEYSRGEASAEKEAATPSDWLVDTDDSIEISDTAEEAAQESESTPHQHDFLAATCTAPRICSSCGETEGSAAGHSWKSATCESPKSCSFCGETEGSPAGHSWKSATCTSPKRCAACGETEGSAADHSYVSGKCSSCGSSDPSYVSEVMVWIPTNGGTKYHNKSSCSNMKNPAYVTRSQAISRGFGACKKCY